MYKAIILEELKKQKQALCMTHEVIAYRSGVGIATVKRIFAGHDVSLDRLEKIAIALDCELSIKPRTSPKSLYNSQINKKAQEIVNKVIQTSALENQAIDMKTEQKMLSQAKAMIAKMPKSQVWE